MTIQNCPNCGGTHYGSNKCPFIPAPCVVCGMQTVMACSDCAIDNGGKESVHVCNRDECRSRHEAEKHPPKPKLDIVERLRTWDDRIECREAADEIERLRTQVEQRVSVELLQVERDTGDRLRDENAKLRAQVEAKPLWCLHVRGPDDVYAAPDYETALKWADMTNALNWRAGSGLKVRLPESYEDCLLKAVPAIWLGTPEAHAENLPKSIADFAIPALSSDERA